MEVLARITHSRKKEIKKNKNPLEKGKEEVAPMEHTKRGGVQELRPCVTDMEFLIDPPRGETVYVFVHSSSRSSSYTHTHT